MQTQLRYWEYYGMTEKFDELYEKSKHGHHLNVYTKSSYRGKISYLLIVQSRLIRVLKQLVQMEEQLMSLRIFQKKN